MGLMEGREEQQRHVRQTFVNTDEGWDVMHGRGVELTYQTRKEGEVAICARSWVGCLWLQIVHVVEKV